MDWILFNAVFNNISVISRPPVHLSMLFCSSLTSATHNFLFKSLGASPHNHCQNNRQRWDRNESCRNDYHQSLERILAEPGIKPATSCSQVRNATDWAVGLGRIRLVCSEPTFWTWMKWHPSALWCKPVNLWCNCIAENLFTVPRDKFSDCSKLKALADNKLNLKKKKKMKFVLERVENIVGKGENAGYQHFRLFPTVFKRLLF